MTKHAKKSRPSPSSSIKPRTMAVEIPLPLLGAIRQHREVVLRTLHRRRTASSGRDDGAGP